MTSLPQTDTERKVDLTTAQHYHALGFNLVPTGTDKRPVMVNGKRYAWDYWQTTRQTRQDLAGMPWQAGIAAICGPVSGDLVCLDFDGVTSWGPVRDALDALGLGISYPWLVKTLRGGQHVWIRCPDLALDKNKLDRSGVEGCERVELRFAGHYCVLPPSNSGAYEFVQKRTPDQAPAIVTQAQLLAAYDLVTVKKATSTAPAVAPQPAHTGNGYAQAALRNELGILALAQVHTRNNQLNRSSFALGQFVGAGHLDGPEVAQRLLAVALAIGLEESEARRTIESGMGAGAKEPRDIPQHNGAHGAPDFTPPARSYTDDDVPPTDLVVAPAQAPAVKIPTANVVNAAELLTWQFDPLQWTIEGILPAGCYLLAGRPKVGKSWLGLALAIAVASGGRALGHAAVNQGDVLYLGLEDSHRRLHDRIEKLLNGDAAGKVARLDVITECPRLSDGGELIVEGWLDNHPAAKLVIVDTLQRFRPRRQRGTDPYESDYEALQALLAITKRRDVTVVVVHHLRKMSGGDDVFDLVSGTLGLTGAVDGSLVLQRVRGKSDATLHVTGRDLPQDLELGLAWDQTTATWRVAGTAEELRLTRLQFVIFNALRDEGTLSVKDMYEIVTRNKIDTSYDTVRITLGRMAEDGKIRQVERGKYAPKE